MVYTIYKGAERFYSFVDEQQVWFKNGVKNRWKQVFPIKLLTDGHKERH